MNKSGHPSIAGDTKQELMLVQPSLWKREFHLRSGDTVLMTMRYPRWFSSAFVIEGDGATWDVRKTSFWRTALEIKRKENHLPFATFEPEGWMGSGVFKLPNGLRVGYRHNPWKQLNELFDVHGVRLAAFKRASLWKRSLTVTIDGAGGVLTEQPWILMTVYHLILQRRQHAQGAV